MDEIELHTFYSEKGDRKAVVARDKYHYVVHKYGMKQGNLQLWKTTLLDTQSERYAEDLAENFVEFIGPFNQKLEWQ